MNHHRDFTFTQYHSLCRSLRETGRTCVNVAELASHQGCPDPGTVILRHDVDRFPLLALEMARVEKEYGLSASYYFRIPASWDEDVVSRIARMGHEVGLHYECLDKARGDLPNAVRILKDDLARFRKIAPVQTVSMHGNPLTMYDNREVFRDVSLESLGLIGEVYLSVDFSRLWYYSDTGRTWLPGVFNLKDHVSAGQPVNTQQPEIRTTPDLIAMIQTYPKETFYLLIHPDRWARSWFEWLSLAGWDLAANSAKVLIRRVRRYP